MNEEKKISKKAWLWIFGVLIFLLLAAWGTVVYLEYFASESMPVPIPEKPKKLINAGEKIIRLETRNDIASETKNALAQNLSSGDFEVLLFSEIRGSETFYLSPSEFFLAASLHPPQKFFQATTAYNVGIVGMGSTSAPFLIFEISSFENVREEMFVWEKNMPRELIVFFPEFSKISEVDITPRNQIIKNQDTRVLEAPVGKIFYTFFNKNLLIITKSQKTLEDILARYTVFPPN